MQATNLGGAQAVTPRPLGRSDYKTLGLAALGGALEFYDFIIFVFFAPAIGQLFFPAAMPDWLRQLQTFGIFAAGYLARRIPMLHTGGGDVRASQVRVLRKTAATRARPHPRPAGWPPRCRSWW